MTLQTQNIVSSFYKEIIVGRYESLILFTLREILKSRTPPLELMGLSPSSVSWLELLANTA